MFAFEDGSRAGLRTQGINNIHRSMCKLKLNSMALVRERTIPTEWPPPVGEVSTNFLRIEMCKERTIFLNNFSAVWITEFGFVDFAILFQLEMVHP
jgi:hypothetical protein